EITQMGNAYIFRTSFGQQMSMPKIANYIRDGLKAKTVSVLWVNNDFGKGGRDTFVKEMAARNIKVLSDVSTESGQMDFAADVVKLKGANADAIFVYTNEEESARFLREARKQGIDKPLIGETTLLGQKVIDMAGPAANGARGHVGLTADAPVPAVAAWKEKFVKGFGYVPAHAGQASQNNSAGRTICSLRWPGWRPAASTRWSRSVSCCCGRPRRRSTSRRASSSCCRRSSSSRR